MSTTYTCCFVTGVKVSDLVIEEVNTPIEQVRYNTHTGDPYTVSVDSFTVNVNGKEVFKGKLREFFELLNSKELYHGYMPDSYDITNRPPYINHVIDGVIGLHVSSTSDFFKPKKVDLEKISDSVQKAQVRLHKVLNLDLECHPHLILTAG